VLIDGDAVTNCEYPHECVVKGDSKSASVAAASILAKVSRDRYMTLLAEKYPEYMFEKHKGYGTALHIEMLKKYGASPVHRKTFIKKFV
jgi:ribonuclease HII